MNNAFPNIPVISFEGPATRNPFAFRHYNPDEIVEGKAMRDHFRFSATYWHTMRGTGSDPFGMGTMLRPWDDGSQSVENYLKLPEVFFEFLHKAQIPFYAFHDRDVAPEGSNLQETNEYLDKVVRVLKNLQTSTSVRLLWGTACLFAHPRYVHGAATSCNADVFAYAGAQVKKALEISHELGAAGYVFWGGREGYSNLINTDMKRELDHLGRFLHMAVDYAKEIGFTGQFYIEPKPKEPTTHQYDSDSAACLNFLRTYGLLPHFKLNLETNHATLAGHSMQHEMETCASIGMLGSLDANTGDPLLGWDTDEFPYNIAETTHMMLTLLKYGGLTTGGVNFDAKVRRASFEPDDLFHAHILGMDTYARALKIAAAIRADGRLAEFIAQRYSSFDTGIGAKISTGQTSFRELESYIHAQEEANSVRPNESGRQEMLQNLVNSFF